MRETLRGCGVPVDAPPAHLTQKEQSFILLRKNDSYLVDPASSHMLVSKIKPCMSKYKHFIQRNCERLIKSVIMYSAVAFTTRIPVVILELIRACAWGQT